jgi:hypothetical protein
MHVWAGSLSSIIADALEMKESKGISCVTRTLLPDVVRFTADPPEVVATWKVLSVTGMA